MKYDETEKKRINNNNNKKKKKFNDPQTITKKQRLRVAALRAISAAIKGYQTKIFEFNNVIPAILKNIRESV